MCCISLVWFVYMRYNGKTCEKVYSVLSMITSQLLIIALLFLITCFITLTNKI